MGAFFLIGNHERGRNGHLPKGAEELTKLGADLYC